jgi:hypothetical protein
MTTIYKVHSHMKQSRPDGREVVFVGEARDAEQFYNALPHVLRVTHLYLFSENGDDAVAYEDWVHAGIGLI